MATSNSEPANGDANEPVSICQPQDVNEEIVAKSLLEEAGIPFDSRNDGLQDLFGMGQIGGPNLLVGPVQIVVPAEYAEEARHVLEQGHTFEEPEVHGEILGELEAEPEPPAIPENPNAAKVRSAAILSMFCSIFFFGSMLSAAGALSGMFALAVPSRGVPNHWRVFALVGTLGGLIGSWVWVTAV